MKNKYIKKIGKPLLVLGIMACMTYPAFAATGGSSSVFQPMIAFFTSVVDTFRGPLGRLVGIVLVMFVIIGVGVGTKSWAAIFGTLLIISLLFGAPQMVDFIQNTVGQ